MNIIADVAGRFDELMELVKKMPDGEKILFVGDLHDRGPKSKEVIEWVMGSPHNLCLHSNHGDMFVDFYNGPTDYGHNIFLANGGVSTLKSYDVSLTQNLKELIANTREKVPAEHIEWLKTRPYYHEEEGLFVSHAARHPGFNLNDICFTGIGRLMGSLDDHSLLWNRGSPERMEGVLQVFGHNSRMDRFEKDGELWAICIDDCSRKKLTGINWPTKEIYQVPYKEEK